MTHPPQRITFTSSFGSNVSVVIAGDKQKPPILLLHGFPSSANTFRNVIPVLARSAYVVAPDMPGFGQSDVSPTTSFKAFTAIITELLEHLGVGARFIYLHDYGAPVGINIAMNEPDKVLGLIVQNANVHRSGFGPAWKSTIESWNHPTAQNKAAATAHLTLKGVRDQYIADVPKEIARRISPAVWQEDWRVMTLPGRLEAQRSLNADYANHAARFDAIANYLRDMQPPALMVWGRHDAFFDIHETVSWMEDLPRMEAHILDGGHFLLETHAAPAARLIEAFIGRLTSNPGN